MASVESSSLVTDPFLQSILNTSAAAREASLTVLKLTNATPHTANDSADAPTPEALAISRAQKALFAHLSRLRGQNRKLAHRVRQTKQQTSVSRSEIDTLHLSLQNLYYESRHLAGEIAACESFPHKYMQLPMIPEDEFLTLFPEWQGKGEAELMEARIEREYQDRMELEEQRKQLLATKMELMKENAKRKEELGKLDADLERFIDAAKPIQKTFEQEW